MKIFYNTFIKGDKAMKYYYEIYLNDKNVSRENWHDYLYSLQKFIGVLHFWKLIIKLDYNKFRYYIESPIKLPISLNNTNFLLKEREEIVSEKSLFRGIYFNNVLDNVVSIFNNLKKNNKEFSEIIIYMRCYDKENPILSKIEVKYRYKNRLYSKKLLFRIPINILQVDFNKAKSFCYQKFPKYMSLDKVMHLFRNDELGSIMKVDTFPYLEENFFLNHNAFDFDKHSLVMGASGSGKSKFLALFITNIYKYNKQKYKVVVIDPHDSLKDDLGEVQNAVIDFKDDRIIDLFKNNISDVNANVELLMSLFKSLINDSYNAKLERVLRYSIYILLVKKDFSFVNLRRLLLNLDYRNDLIRELKRELPASVSYFFLTDFNELKTSSYNEAIAPIISFIDEMQMVPVFNDIKESNGLVDIINNNFLSIFSLNRISLGDKVTKTIAGLLMQQLFLIAEEKIIDEHIIFIVDEVAVIENPILARYLSEMRKYNVNVILAGQYFSQISDDLKDAILANTLNYYVFRVARSDAILLEKNLEIKLVNSDNEEDKYKLLTNLKNQECLVRLSNRGSMYPAFKAKTVNFVPKVQNNYQKNKFIIKENVEEKPFNFEFNIDSDVTAGDIMSKSSSSRKKV